MSKQKFDKKHSNNLRAIMRANGFTLERLAPMVGLTLSAVQKHAAGKNNMTDEQAVRYSEILNSTPQEIKGFSPVVIKNNEKITIPLLGQVCAGTGLEMIAVEDEMNIPVQTLQGISYRKQKGIFAVRIKGNSMNEFAPDGAIVLVDGNVTDWTQLDNKVVVYERGGQASVKRYKARIKALLPESTDPTFEPEPVDEQVRVLGKALWAMKAGE